MLQEETKMVWVKICGLTNVEDAVTAAALGADALGAVLVEASPRFVTAERARGMFSEVRGELLGRGLKMPAFVVVTVAERPEDVLKLEAELKGTGVMCVQLHGEEPPSLVRALKKQGLKLRIIKKVGVGGANADADELIRSAAAYDAAGADAILLDTQAETLGGSGRAHDWRLSRAVTFALQGRAKVILAGGLNPENVEAAVKTVRPFGVDVSSGVELRKGKKDSEKVKRFIERAKSVRVE
ncbi:phosphoribosylanthranilate isomerase [Candidatus Alkanophaga liquidiphilum]|nr:Phosphoribosylanthranilate isomerase [Candidatus Alkanophaga liquidiphilum]